MNARPRGPWRRALPVVLATFALVLGAAAVASALAGDSATSFAQLSAALSDGINAHQAVFASSARGGRDAFTGLAAGMIVASLVMVAGCAWGLSRRLAEYR